MILTIALILSVLLTLRNVTSLRISDLVVRNASAQVARVIFLAKPYCSEHLLDDILPSLNYLRVTRITIYTRKKLLTSQSLCEAVEEKELAAQEAHVWHHKSFPCDQYRLVFSLAKIVQVHKICFIVRVEQVQEEHARLTQLDVIGRPKLR